MREKKKNGRLRATTHARELGLLGPVYLKASHVFYTPSNKKRYLTYINTWRALGKMFVNKKNDRDRNSKCEHYRAELLIA